MDRVLQVLEGARFALRLVQGIISARALEHEIPGFTHRSPLGTNLLDRGVLKQQPELMQIDSLQSVPLVKRFDWSLPSERQGPKQTPG